MSEDVDCIAAGQPPGTYRVGIMGASLHTGNRGVSALGASLVKLIRESRPHSEIALLVGNREATRTVVHIGTESTTTVDTINYRLSPRAPLGQQLWWIVFMSSLYRLVPWTAARKWIARTSTWIQTIENADLVGDIRGGDSFSDIYGVKNFFLGCLPAFSAIWVRGRIHLFPQTYGPFRSKFSECLARRILMRADTICCRDRVSLTEVSRLTAGQRHGVLCPDVAFSLEAARPKAQAVTPPLCEDGSIVLGLNISGLVYHGGYNRANMFDLTLDYRTFVCRLMEQMLSDPSIRILLVPHTFAPEGSVESDPAACRDVLRRLPIAIRDRVHLVTTECDQHEIKSLIGLCDFFIGSRMHACIAALSQGIPTIGVAYSRKFAGVFDTVGALEFVIDGRHTRVEAALHRVAQLFRLRDLESARLRTTSAATRQELRRIFSQVIGAASA